MKDFYRFDKGILTIGVANKLKKGDIEYKIGEEPQELLDALAAEREQSEFRDERNEYLKKCDIAIYKAEDLSQDTTELRALRQSLRDATKDWVMPDVSILI